MYGMLRNFIVYFSNVVHVGGYYMCLANAQRASLTCSRSWRSGYQQCVHVVHRDLISRFPCSPNWPGDCLICSTTRLCPPRTCTFMLHTHGHFRTLQHVCTCTRMAWPNWQKSTHSFYCSLALYINIYPTFVIGTGWSSNFMHTHMKCTLLPSGFLHVRPVRYM